MILEKKNQGNNEMFDIDQPHGSYSLKDADLRVYWFPL